MLLIFRVKYCPAIIFYEEPKIMRKNILNTALFILCIFTAGAGVSRADEGILEFPITGVQDIISSNVGEIDSANGNALLIDAEGKTEVMLFDLDGRDLGNKKLVYSARMRSESLTATDDTRGIAYLRMTVLFPDGEELIARGPRVPLSGTTDWRSAETLLYVDKGLSPESVKLALVVDGAGKIWIENIKLRHRPLRTDYLFWGHVVVWIVLIIYIYSLIRKQGRLTRELRPLQSRT
jgi:CcmD family protein